jgi:putative inorganic carbon (hco3(-)) transporter
MIEAARKVAYWLLLSLPLTTALFFSSAFSPEFAAPKNAIFTATAVSLAALALLYSSRWQPEKGDRAFWVAIVAFLALNMVSALLAHDRSLCIESVAFSSCGVLLLAGAPGALTGHGQKTRGLLVAIAAAASLVALVTVAQFFRIDLHGVLGFTSNYAGRMRMYSTLGNPDFVASFLAVAMPAALALSLTAPRLRALWIAASVLIGGAVLLTGSRGGAIAMAAGVSVVALTLKRKRAVRVSVPILAGALVVCALAAGTGLNPRTVSESLRGRMIIWQVSLGEGAAQSAFGAGPGTFAYIYPAELGRFFTQPGRDSMLRFATHERHAQNDFVEAWHDAGWLGLASLVALLGTWFAMAIQRLRKSEEEARPAISVAIAAVLALCFASLFDFPMHRAETWSLLWVLMAVPLASAAVLPVRIRRFTGLKVAGAALLIVAAAYGAFAPLAASYRLAQGELDENNERLDSSVKAYRAALRWEASSADANFDLVRALARTGDVSGALAQAAIATRYVNEPELYILRSRILLDAGSKAEARRELETAVRLFPYSEELRDEIASYSLPDSGAPSR